MNVYCFVMNGRVGVVHDHKKSRFSGRQSGGVRPDCNYRVGCLILVSTAGSILTHVMLVFRLVPRHDFLMIILIPLDV